MKRFIQYCLLLLLIISKGFAQVYIDWTPGRIADELLYVQYSNPTSISSVHIDNYTDSLNAAVRGSKPLKMHCEFSKDAKCSVQKIYFECDECMSKWVYDILDDKKHKWKGFEGHLYSSPESAIEMEIDMKKLVLVLMKSKMTKVEYKKMYTELLGTRY